MKEIWKYTIIPTGMRTKYCRKLGEEKCKSAETIVIKGCGEIIVANRILNFDEEKEFAIAGGFETLSDFYDFFRDTHGLPFFGFIIK